MSRPAAVATADWFITAPLDISALRRGDPLGLQPAAERYAQALAPGLSNRTIDARWITLLCWSLREAHDAWSVLGAQAAGEGLGTPEGARELYAWLRPLELLWVARTVKATKDRGQDRQLPGVRAVRRWDEGGGVGPRHGLAPSSYTRYRFTGVYGAYRAALRALPGLTVHGSGWQLDSLGRQLAALVGEPLGPHQRSTSRRPTPESWWAERSAGLSLPKPASLPTLLARPAPLPRSEREAIARALLSTDIGSQAQRQASRRRRAVIEAVASSTADSRAGLFDDLLRKLHDPQARSELAGLPAFCALADAGVDAMNACWAVACADHGGRFATLDDLLAAEPVATALEACIQAARRWLRDVHDSDRDLATAHALAQVLVGARDLRARLLALEQHHRRHGGGLRWLAVEGSEVKPLAPVRQGEASAYAFRASALLRMAVQAGALDALPPALQGTTKDPGEEDAS